MRTLSASASAATLVVRWHDLTGQLIQGRLFPEEFDDVGRVGGDEAPAELVAATPGAAADPPHIRTLWLEHFKRFDQLQVDLAPFNVLAGSLAS